MEENQPPQKKLKLKDGVAATTAAISVESPPQVCNKNELQVGIRNFLNTTATRFSGIVKQRYSDFVVRECDLKGDVVNLTSLEHIDDVKDDSNKEEMTTESSIPPPISQDEVQNIKQFIEAGDHDAKLTLETDNDKEHRKIVHKYIKETFKELETGTAMLENENRAILITFRNSKNKDRRGRPRDKNKTHCHFVLFKQNKDTMSCINELASKIHVHPSSFTYAGTKDKRATTTQRLAVKHVLSKQLAGLNKHLRNAAVGNFSYAKEALRLGDLSGNEFVLVIRDVKGTDECVSKACHSLKANGFINYFGLQRFGTGAHPTHEIGKSLLRGEIVKAVNMILTSRVTDDDDKNTIDYEHEAKKEWQTSRDPHKAVKKLRSRSSLEAKLINALCSDKTKMYQTERTCMKAFLALPRNMRSFYLHSYQSLVWNLAVSHRLNEFGCKVVKGDLVIVENEKDERGFELVHTVTDDDITREKYSVYDIVLPLPGYDMVYPEYLKSFYEGTLKDDGLTFQDLKSKEKEFWLSGKYRKVLIRPKSTTWKLIRYDDPTVALFENDLEKIKPKKQRSQSTTVDGEKKEETDLERIVKDKDLNGKEKVDDIVKDEKAEEKEEKVDFVVKGYEEEKMIVDSSVLKTEHEEKIDNNVVGVGDGGRYKGLILSITLPSSCYATCALREVLLHEVSYAAQTKLNSADK